MSAPGPTIAGIAKDASTAARPGEEFGHAQRDRSTPAVETSSALRAEAPA